MRDEHKTIPRLNYKLTGVDNFAGWVRGFRLCLFIYHVECVGKYMYALELVEGDLE